METKEPMWGGESFGNSEQVKPRPISSLKPTEAIQVNNDAERDGILKLMEAEGWKWNTGDSAKEVTINNSFPYALAYKFEGTDGFSNIGIRIVDLDYDGKVSFLPASDFIPTEPKPQVDGQEKQVEFKKGDYVRGLMVGFDKEEEGEIVDFYRNNEELFVNTGFYLTTSTCRHIPRPNETAESNPTEQQIDWTKPQPFPKRYVIPKGVECLTLIDSTWNEFKTPEKTKVRTIIGSSFPLVERRDGVHRDSFDDFVFRAYLDERYYSHDLAPLDPTDHPLHPEFKGASDGVIDGVNDGATDGVKPTQPIDYKSLFHQAQSKVDELQAKIEDLNETYEFDRVQRSVHREIIREKIINYAKNYPSSHSAQLLGELILDGLI